MFPFFHLSSYLWSVNLNNQFNQQWLYGDPRIWLSNAPLCFIIALVSERKWPWPILECSNDISEGHLKGSDFRVPLYKQVLNFQHIIKTEHVSKTCSVHLWVGNSINPYIKISASNAKSKMMNNYKESINRYITKICVLAIINTQCFELTEKKNYYLIHGQVWHSFACLSNT